MAVKSNVQIHVTLTGDINLDEVVTCQENTNSPGISYVQSLPPNVFTAIYNPFTEAINANYIITGLLIIPPRDNRIRYSVTADINYPVLVFHPYNPTFLSITNMDIGGAIYISFGGTTNLVFRFIWV